MWVAEMHGTSLLDFLRISYEVIKSMVGASNFLYQKSTAVGFVRPIKEHAFMMFASNTTTNHSNSHCKSSTTSPSTTTSVMLLAKSRDPISQPFRCGPGGGCFGPCHSTISLRRLFPIEKGFLGHSLWWRFYLGKLSQIRKRFDMPLICWAVRF